MVLTMIGIGGYTRLSGSGLSMVDWQPVVGWFPPLSAQAWADEFARYQLFPEFEKVNSAMSLADFQRIYLVEYFHRLWGRLMGLVLLVPTALAFFKYRPLLPKLGLVWFLSICQAMMGWYMVKSGLVNDPMVSPFRLTAHLLLALLILSVLLYSLSSLRPSSHNTGDSQVRPWLMALATALLVTLSFGGLTAGNHAGLIYNTFPLMNGDIIPQEAFFLSPWWVNLYANPAMIQFLHRTLALSTLALGIYICLHFYSKPLSSKLRHVLYAIGAGLAMQVTFGVVTLVLHVPVYMGVVHQVWAAVVFATVLWAIFISRENRMNYAVA